MVQLAQFTPIGLEAKKKVLGTVFAPTTEQMTMTHEQRILLNSGSCSSQCAYDLGIHCSSINHLSQDGLSDRVPPTVAH